MSGGVWLTPFKFDACTFIALTDDGLQRLTQSRCETSSSSTVDDFEDLTGVLGTLKKIYKEQYEKIFTDVYPPAVGSAGANHADPHLLEFVQVNLVYNQKKLYQAAKAMQINERTVSGLGDYIFSNALDLNDERDIFDFSNVM